MYDFKKTEQKVFKHWQENKIYQKAKDKSKNGKIYYWLDGPPYTSGKVHLGTAWNKSLKDIALRYKRMQGFNVWDRAGYDMHGLPTAHAVMKKLGLKHKEDIEKFGVEKFINACKKLSVDNMHIMNKDFKRLGVWMDFENAYQSIKSEFVEGVWWLVKKAHENNRLYEGKLAMTWCRDCGTALAKHELEYENVSEDSIFVKFPVIGTENEFLVIWTTTPWTIPFNLAVMVHPELEYVKAKVEDEIWIVAKGLVGTFISGVAEKKFEIVEQFPGEKLQGLKYQHPFYKELKPVYDEIISKSEKAFSVVLSSEYVDLSAGTGLVHTAPGCGPEDYEIGHKEGIPPFNNLDQAGKFPENMGKFSGLIAKKHDNQFIEALKQSGKLVGTTKVDHDYAHCWRCKSPVIYRTTKQWFFKIEDLKQNMRELNKEIYWVPDHAGSKNFDSWIANLRDNGITRQRYWGTPLPVWRCKECEEYVVVGSKKELKDLAGELPKDLHKPWIDNVTFKCKCGGQMKRIPDILDVWIDAGSASWLCLDYPHRKDLFEKMFPADFILEGIDQIRGWFNMLFVASMVSMEKPSFKAVYMHGFINDAKGRKMSKSEGNYILPEEVLEKYGADTLRYYMVSGANPGVDLNYNFDDMKVKFRNLGVLWNLHKYLISYCKVNNVNPSKLEIDKYDPEEKFIISKLNSCIENATQIYDKYLLNETPDMAEELFLSLSRTYITLVRDKLSVGTNQEKEMVLKTIYDVLIGALKIFAPVAPYISDAIYLNLKEQFDLETESIHLFDWPKADKNLINKKLEEQFEISDTIIQKILYCRDKLQLGRRWPLPKAVIVTEKQEVEDAVEKLQEVIKVQTNLKQIVVKDDFKSEQTVKTDYNKLNREFKSLSAKIIAHISITSPQTVLSHIQKQGEYKFKVDGAEVSITKDHLIVEKKAPKGYVLAETNFGDIFVNGEQSQELLAEGYARETVRRVQSLRKKAGLKQSDEIKLYIKVGKELKQMLSSHEEEIQERVGAKEQTVSELNPSIDYKHESEDKINNKKINVFISD
ncbi:MAG: Isoleucine--tRNA ligase [Candidatus Woesearchaeota archaeon]|nr:Isoleucine--tRNA ligase [Candidatus Woesearchaeota archaeon]